VRVLAHRRRKRIFARVVARFKNAWRESWYVDGGIVEILTEASQAINVGVVYGMSRGSVDGYE
jgi:hypothetical protein